VPALTVTGLLAKRHSLRHACKHRDRRLRLPPPPAMLCRRRQPPCSAFSAPCAAPPPSAAAAPAQSPLPSVIYRRHTRSQLLHSRHTSGWSSVLSLCEGPRNLRFSLNIIHHVKSLTIARDRLREGPAWVHRPRSVEPHKCNKKNARVPGRLPVRGRGHSSYHGATAAR
jgi:hypothetical protein